MKTFKILFIMTVASMVYSFDGLFADGFAASSWSDAIRHVSGRITDAHSGSGKVDGSSLANMTEEQLEAAFMVHVDDEKRKENDPRKETLSEWIKFKEDVKIRDFTKDRKVELIQEIDKTISSYERKITKGLYKHRYEAYDNCLNSCAHDSELQDMQCITSEIDNRQDCEEMSIVNPMKLKCLYDMSENKRSCSKDSDWSYQLCQSKCGN